MIRTENLTKVYRGDDVETLALKDVNLAIEQGEFVSIMGPSGSGKTTLLNMLGLLDSPTSGKYWFNYKDVSNYTDVQRTNFRKGRIGYVFQNFNLIEELSVFENVELPLIYSDAKSNERNKRVEEILSKLRISHRRNSFPKQLSGGQQQLVSIARAVVTQPQLILADEPTGNLDSVNGEMVMELLSEINSQGTTVVMVTHSSLYAQKANRVIQLFDGQILSKNILKAI